MRPGNFDFYVTRGLLLASGLLAAGIAATTLIAPEVLYALYGIEIGADVNLINELKAPAGVFLVAGLLTMSGVLTADFVKPSLCIATVVYLSYGVSRLASMAIDGIPEIALVAAAVIEILVGAACLLRLVCMRRTTPIRQAHTTSVRPS